jgi:ABC-2 type transport system permease protein
MSIATSTLSATVPSNRSAARNLFRDTGLVMTRELRPVLHDPFSLVFGMIQPLVFLALFGPLLVGSLGGQADSALGGSVWQWFVPAILVMTALFGTSTVGANLLFEFQTGAHERLLVTPLSRPSLLIGRALKEMVPLAAQAVIIVVVMIPFGFQLYAAGALILSGMLLPLESGPEWMQVASHFNPLTYLVNAERALFAGDVGSAAAAWGWLAALVTVAVGLTVGIRSMRRSAE